MRKNVILFSAVLAASSAFGGGSTFLPVTQSNWTGFYAGGNVGFDQPQDHVTSTAAGEISSANLKSEFSGGGQVGYNRQYRQFVTGVQLNLGYLGFYGNRPFTSRYVPVLLGAPDEVQEVAAVSSGGFYGTLMGRAGGSLVHNRIFPFLEAGLAFADLKLGVEDLQPVGLTINAAHRKFYYGPAYGAGFEVAINSKWAFNTDYVFADFGNDTISGVANDGRSYYWYHKDIAAQIVRFGIDYKFSA
jgi:outer membrane immunogenic protein